MATAASASVALSLTGSTITSCLTGGGSVFVTFVLRCLRLYCSGYLRSSQPGGPSGIGQYGFLNHLLERHFLVISVAHCSNRLTKS